jgi:Fibronectin type III domain
LKALGLAAFMLIASLSAGPDSAQAASLDVSWASNTEADLAGYRLRLGTVSGQYTRTIDAEAATSVQVDSLETDVTYFLAVFAYDVAGNESVASPEVSARLAAPLAPLPAIDSVVDVDSDSIYLMRGRPHTLIIRGRNIQEGAAISLGPGVISTRLARNPDGELISYVLVSNFASPGRRTLTLINPDLATTSVSDAIAFVKTPDTNLDCSVDIVDLNAIARSWNVSSGEPAYSAASDLDGDAYVGPEDLTIFVKFLGRPLPGCP